MNVLPTIVLVPGAFHVKSAVDLLNEQLKDAGFSTESFGLATVGRPQITIEDDAAALFTQVLEPLIEQHGKDIVLYLHSYAGFPGSTAIRGLSKTERLAAGKRGGMLGLIYQSAFIPKPENTLLQMIGGQFAPWQDPDTKNGLVNLIDPKTTFYADVSEPLATKAVKELRPQSLLCFNMASGEVFYGGAVYDKRRTYLHSNKDQAHPPFAQDAFVSGSGVEWDVQQLDTSHSPFFSEPKQLAAVVIANVKAFIATY
ncbi:MAG: hypothetical protein Q9169_002814 [Polycauliona sp. 2 TL-2023]